MKTEIYLYIHETNGNEFYTFNIIICKFDHLSPIPLFNKFSLETDICWFIRFIDYTLILRRIWLVNFGRLALKNNYRITVDLCYSLPIRCMFVTL